MAGAYLWGVKSDDINWQKREAGKLARGEISTNNNTQLVESDLIDRELIYKSASLLLPCFSVPS